MDIDVHSLLTRIPKYCSLTITSKGRISKVIIFGSREFDLSEQQGNVAPTPHYAFDGALTPVTNLSVALIARLSGPGPATNPPGSMPNAKLMGVIRHLRQSCARSSSDRCKKYRVQSREVKDLNGELRTTFVGIVRYTGIHLRRYICPHTFLYNRCETAMAEILFTLNTGAKIPALGFGKNWPAFKNKYRF